MPVSATDRSPALIGEAPSRTGDYYYHFPLSGAVARRLCGLAGIPPLPGESMYGRWTWALYECFDCYNVFERYAEATPWDRTRALVRASEIGDEIKVKSDAVVLLGRRVQAAFGHESDFYEWVDHGWFRVASIPHPSGLNRLLNDDHHRRMCGVTLRAAMSTSSQVKT